MKRIKPKLSSRIRDEKVIIAQVEKDAFKQFSRQDAECTKLRESVLNKLWDSLPPEIDISSHSEDDADSDSTQSGLEENQEEEEQDRIEESPEIDKDLTISSCDVNLDFIQSIIWLKSTIEKLQRVPANELIKVFKNQWELSPKNDVSTKDNSSRNSFFMKTKQCEKIDLIRNRLAGLGNFQSNNKSVVVIPETDESETSSPESSQRVMKLTTAPMNNTRILESIGNFTTDSGFDSEKPESVDFINASEDVDGKRKTSSSSLRENIDPYDNKTGEKKISKKRKYHSVFEGASKSYKKTPQRSRFSVCSASLNHVLRSSECNKVLIHSVNVILKFIENEDENLCYNNPNNDWFDPVKKEAIDAVVSVVDLMEKEKGSSTCKNEVVSMIKRVLEKMLFSSEIDKAAVWEHRRMVILELCNASSVCREILNYLILELKKLIPVPILTTQKNMKSSIELMDKSYIIFHALKISLQKYTSFAKRRVVITEEKNSSQIIPEVTDLWKKHWRVGENQTDIFSRDFQKPQILEDPVQGWIEILEELVVACATVWPLVKILAWECLTVLKSIGQIP